METQATANQSAPGQYPPGTFLVIGYGAGIPGWGSQLAVVVHWPHGGQVVVRKWLPGARRWTRPINTPANRVIGSAGTHSTKKIKKELERAKKALDQ